MRIFFCGGRARRARYARAKAGFFAAEADVHVQSLLRDEGSIAADERARRFVGSAVAELGCGRRVRRLRIALATRRDVACCARNLALPALCRARSSVAQNADACGAFAAEPAFVEVLEQGAATSTNRIVRAVHPRGARRGPASR
ncbi:MAG TPA: hypothetical protein VGC30_10680 [Dokdonella sp.]